MARSDSALTIIVNATRRGSLSAEGARRWARRAAAGEDITFIRQLAKAGDRVTGAELTTVTNDVASILAGSAAVTDAARSRAGEMTDAEADSLWPPRSPDEAEARFSAAEAARRSYTDGEIHRQLFGGES